MISRINSSKLILTITLLLSGTFFKDSHNLYPRCRPAVPLGCYVHCFLSGRACRVCGIWLDSPLLYRTRYCIQNRHDQSADRLRNNNTKCNSLMGQLVWTRLMYGHILKSSISPSKISDSLLTGRGLSKKTFHRLLRYFFTSLLEDKLTAIQVICQEDNL